MKNSEEMSGAGIGIILFACLSSISIDTVFGVGETCVDDNSCTQNFEVCNQSNKTCVCDTSNNYFYSGSQCVLKVELGSSGCSTAVSDSCNSPNAQCGSNGGTCECKSGYYDDNGVNNGGTCRAKVELGSSGCSTTVSDSCKSPNAQCRSNGGTCECKSGYYDDNGINNGGTCRAKVELGSSGCSTTVSDSCKSPNAQCRFNGGTCECKSGFFDDNGRTVIGTCRAKVELGSSGCSTTVSDSCNSPNAQCGSNGGTCECKSGYYDDNGVNNGGTCRAKVELGSSGCSTTVSDSCKSPNAQCRSNGGTCECESGYYDDNGINNGGTCRAKVELGSSGCSTTVSDSCKSPNAQCRSHGGTCECESGYYDDNGGTIGGSCRAKVELGSSGCSTTVSDSCNSPNAQCRSHGGTCECKSGYYDDNEGAVGGTCRAKVELESSGCSTTVSDSCKSPDAQCRSHGGTCECESGYFDDDGETVGGTCRAKVELGSSGCSTTVSDSCNSPNAQCRSHGGTCECESGYFDDNGGTVGGTCRAKVELGSSGCSTTVSDSCKSPNAQCRFNGGTCECKSGYFDDNGRTVSGSCRAKVELGSSGCSTTVSDSCKSPNAQCRSHGGTCECRSGYYDDNGAIVAGTCRAKVELGSSGCSTTVSDSCKSPNAQCRSNGGTCECESFYYDDNGVNNSGTCRAKVELGSSGCSTTVSDSCKSPNAQCRSHGGTCECESGYFDDDGGTVGGTCRAKVELGSSGCSTNVSDSCKSPNAQCRSHGGTCECESGYFDDDGGTVGGTCRAKVDLGSSGCSTTVSDSCKSPNAQCRSHGGTCECRSGYYDDNGAIVAGTCRAKVELGSSGCSTTVSDSCKSPNAQCRSTGGTCECESFYYDDNGVNNSGTCRAKVELGSSGCSTTVSNSCKSPNAQCRSHGGTCECESGYYDDNGGTIGGTCREKVELGSSGCSTAVSDSCKSPNAQCRSNGGTCECKSGYYDDNGRKVGGTCRAKVELGSSGCSTTVSNSCNSPNAQCRFNGGTCECKSGYFDDNGGTIGGSCRAKVELGSSGCSTGVSDSCKSPNAQCRSHGGTCECKSGYYDDNGGTIGGTCRASKILGQNCGSLSGECKTSYAECLDGKCTCGSNYFDSNGFTDGGSCFQTSNLRVKEINFPANSVTTSGFTVRWTAPDVTFAQNVNSYFIEWRLKTQDNSLNGGSKEVSPSVTSLLVTAGVTAGKTYNMTVTSKNTLTQSNNPRTTSVSKEQAAKPNTPGAIDKSSSDLHASAGVPGITLHWARPTGGVSGYNLTLSDGTDTSSSESVLESVTFNPFWLKNGHWYNVTIQAKSETFGVGNVAFGEVYREEIKTVVTAPDAPRYVTCKDIFDQSIVLAWQIPSEPNGDLVRYTINVYDSNKTYLFNTSTAEVAYTHTIKNLKPGTQYTFKVFTQNEQYMSTTTGDTTCQTKQTLYDPPYDLHVVMVTSRNFTVQWDEPDNTHSEENYGYVIQTREGEKCIKEIVYKCTDCFGSFEISALENMCDSLVRDVLSRTKSQLAGSQSHQFISLLPDTTYTISASAINSKGRGNVARITQTTSEEVPPAPYNVIVSDIKSTSFLVAWSMNGVRPGKTNFTVILTADSPAISKEFTVTGYTTRSFYVRNLEEFWNYFVSVKAVTSVGSRTSLPTSKQQTLPSAPGEVSDFHITFVPCQNYTPMQATWKAPDILHQNSIIKEYKFIYRPLQNSGLLHSIQLQHEATDTHEYTVSINVRPEHTYTVQVYAVNEQNQDGEKTIRNITIPARALKSTVQESNGSTQTVIVGVVLGLIIIILSVYAGYVTILIRKYRGRKDCSQEHKTKKRNKKEQLYVNELFTEGTAGVDGRSSNPVTIRNPESEYSRLDDATREEKTEYDIIHAM